MRAVHGPPAVFLASLVATAGCVSDPSTQSTQGGCGIFTGSCDEVAEIPFLIEPSNHSNRTVHLELRIHTAEDSALVWRTSLDLSPGATAQFHHESLRGDHVWVASVDGKDCSTVQSWGHGFHWWHPEIRPDGSVVHLFQFDDYNASRECQETIR